MKETFDISMAFEELDKLYTPKNKLKENYKRKSLFEDAYDVGSKAELEKAKEEISPDVAVKKLNKIERIIDLDAGSIEDLKDTYTDKIIVQCPQCLNLFYRDKNDLTPDEMDKDLVNVGEECQHCGNKDGYNVIGQVAKTEIKNKEEEPVEAEEIEEPVEKQSEEENKEEENTDTAKFNIDDFLSDKEVGEPEEENKEEEVKESLSEGMNGVSRQEYEKLVYDMLHECSDINECNDLEECNSQKELTESNYDSLLASVIKEAKKYFPFNNKIEDSEEELTENIQDEEAEFSDFVSEIHQNIEEEVYNTLVDNPEFGFTPEDIKDYTVVDVNLNSDSDMIEVEVRAEVEYSGLEALCEALNPIVQYYDEDAYFEPVESGIISAYLDKNKLKSFLNNDKTAHIKQDKAAKDIDEIDEKSFNDTVSSALTDTYSNVADFEMTECSRSGKDLIVEGIVNFKSGKKKNASFTLRESNEKYIGTGSLFNNSRFEFTCKKKNNTLLTESLNYRFTIGENNIVGEIKH